MWSIQREPIPVCRNEVVGQVPRIQGVGASVVEGVDDIGGPAGFWTLFGPDPEGRCGPRGNGPPHQISTLGPQGTPEDTQNQLEVGVRASWNES